MEPGTPESPFGRGGPGVRLASLAAAEQLREREAMNLKMEVAHLRERLHQRVGGDTTAIELEDENFTLRRALQDAQQALVAQREAADARHAKAMLNLVRLDGAWKAGATELARAQQQAQEAQARADDLEARRDGDARQLRAALERADALQQQVDSMRAQQRSAEQQLRQLQQLSEEADALRDERAALSRQVQSARKEAEERFKQLEADCAATEARLADAEQHRHDAERLRSELARAQSEMYEGRERLAQVENETARLKQQVVEQQQQIEHIPQVHRAEYERLVREKESAWQQREETLAQQVRDAQLDASQAHSQARELKQLQREVLQLLAGGDSSESSAGGREATGEEVRTRVKREVHKAKLVALEAEKAKVRIEGLERQLAKQAKVAQENSELRAESDRLKKKLATARTDRLDVNRTPVKSSRSSERAKLKIESLEHELAALAAENADLRAENETLRKDVETARSEATEASRAAASVAFSSEQAKLTYERLERELAKQLKVVEENDELRRANTRLRADVEAARSESAEASRASADASLSVHSAQRRIESMERELAKQRKNTQENDELRAENARLKKELAAARVDTIRASVSPALTPVMRTQSTESTTRESSWRTMFAQKNVSFGAGNSKASAVVARNESTEESETPPADLAASVEKTSQGGEGAVRKSAWKRSVVTKISREISAEHDKTEDVVTARFDRAGASTTPVSLPVSFEARQMIERIQRESTKLGNPARQIDEVRSAESDKKTATCTEKTEASKTPASAGSVGKQSLEERLAQLRARAEPLRAKRKIGATEEQPPAAGGADRVRKIFGLSRAHSAVRASADRSASAPVGASAAPTEAAASTPETHSGSSEESTKSKFRRVFVSSRYLNHVTGRRADP